MAAGRRTGSPGIGRGSWLRRNGRGRVGCSLGARALGGAGRARCRLRPRDWLLLFHDGTLARSSLQKYVGPLRHVLHEQLERGAECACKKTAGTCRKLLAQEPSLWTFVWIEGIEPTNNDAERVLRHAVLWRKSSGGTDSEAGSRFVERMLSVVATARQQNRNVLELLIACCTARLDGSAIRDNSS